jgi:hypothetical protein
MLDCLLGIYCQEVDELKWAQSELKRLFKKFIKNLDVTKKNQFGVKYSDHKREKEILDIYHLFNPRNF